MVVINKNYQLTDLVLGQLGYYTQEEFLNLVYEGTNDDRFNEENKQMTKNVLVYTLRSIVKLLHPFIPFVTEEIYQTLPHTEESITISKWPLVREEFNDEAYKYKAISNFILKKFIICRK